MSKITIHDLNDRQLAMIPSGVRASLGKSARTTSDAVADSEVEAERKIQSDIANYLTLHDIEFIRPPMNKRSMLPPGWPDFTAAYRGIPMVLEAKTLTGELSPDQEEMHAKLSKNGWRVAIVRGVQDVQTILREIDATQQDIRLKP